MKIKINEIRKICEKILIRNGVKVKATKIIVDDYIEGELLNKTSHGLFAFVNGIYKNNEISSNADQSKIKIEKNFDVLALINGHKQSGQLVAELARKLVIKKAKKYGIAMVATYKSKSFLRPGSQAEYIARNNLIGLVFHNGGNPSVAPYGGIYPILATNPIGYAIPTSKYPIVLDMATSEHAWGEVRIAKKMGTNLPLNAFINKSGEITINPNEAFSALPFGGYKGFGLGIMAEIFSGSLVGNGVGFNKISDKKTGKKYRGAVFIAINPGKIVNFTKFKKENTQLIKELKNSRKRPGVKEIFIPGEKAYKNKAKCLKRGWFEVDKKIIEQIYNLNKNV